MQRTRKQTGHIYRKGGWWYLRYYDTLIQPDGSAARKLVTRKLAPYPEFRSKDSVRPLADEFLAKLNSGKLRPEGTMTLTQFWESSYWPYVQTAKRPATARGYRQMWQDYLKPRCGTIRLREFRCCDGERVLSEIERQEGFAHSSFSRLKSLLSAIFTHAKRQGVLDGTNPVQGVSIPKGKPALETYAYSLQETLGMLKVLLEPASVVVAVAAFTGLDKGEIWGLRWEDYDGKQITVRRKVWVGNNGGDSHFHVIEPKTAKRKAAVPVFGLLAKMLDAYRGALGNPAEGWLFPAPDNHDKPLNLDNLARRAIRPVIEKKELTWHGWHAFRRGLATNLHDLSVDDKTIQAVLRHADIKTTVNVYIKSLPEQSVRSMEQLEKRIQQVSDTIQ